MSPITTRAPASTISRAVSAPMPRAAPEIRATLPSSRFIAVLPQNQVANDQGVSAILFRSAHARRLPERLFERRTQEFQTEVDFALCGRQWRGDAHNPL